VTMRDEKQVTSLADALRNSLATAALPATVGHRRPDHEDCECAEELDHALHDCTCPGYPLRDAQVTEPVDR
jgi:hypothetical protein